MPDKDTPPPSAAMMQLLAPDGYYTYLGVPKKATPTTAPTSTNSTDSTSPTSKTTGVVDEDIIKKTYRKLSLKHHPDRSGGDAETFRVLNRAQKVLTSPKLRQQYDILGLDLDDDEADNDNSGDDGDANSGEDQPTTSQGIVHEIASMVLTTILQMGVRTLMMSAVSLLVVRYIWTLLPGLAFLAFIAYRIHSLAGVGSMEVLSPFLIGGGLVLMHQSYYTEGSWLVFWIGESLVIAMFTFNSLSGVAKSTPLYVGVGIFSTLAALWFRGKFWNYVIVLGLELFLAVFVAMAFPIMEMVLEAILNDKLKKVGDKVRAHHQHLERYYESKR